MDVELTVGEPKRISSARMRSQLGEVLHAQVRAHNDHLHEAGVGRKGQVPLSESVAIGRREAAVLRDFLGRSLLSALLATEEREACEAHIAFLESCEAPRALGQSILVPQVILAEHRRCFLAAGILADNSNLPWAPHELRGRLLRIGFPCTVEA